MYTQLAFFFFLSFMLCTTCYGIYLMYQAERYIPTPKRKYITLAFLAYVSVVIALTIIPSDRFRLNKSIPLTNYIPLINTYKRYAMVTYFENYHGIKNFWQNFIGNIFLFIPLGIFLRWLFRRRFWEVMIIAFFCSAFIELVQYLNRFFGYYRHIDIDDVLLNTLGAISGYFGFTTFCYLKKHKRL